MRGQPVHIEISERAVDQFSCVARKNDTPRFLTKQDSIDVEINSRHFKFIGRRFAIT